MTDRKHSFPQRRKLITAFRSPHTTRKLQFQGSPYRKTVERSSQTPLETHRKAITMLTFQKEKGGRAFSSQQHSLIAFSCFLSGKKGRWVMAARSCKRPQGSWTWTAIWPPCTKAVLSYTHKNAWAGLGGLVPRTAPQTHSQLCALNALLSAHPLAE